MRILVCGDSKWSDAETIQEILSLYPSDSIVITNYELSEMIEKITTELKMETKYIFPYWSRYGKKAIFFNVKEMFDEQPNMIFVFCDDLVFNKQIKTIIAEAKKKKLPIFIYEPKKVVHKDNFV